MGRKEFPKNKIRLTTVNTCNIRRTENRDLHQRIVGGHYIGKDEKELERSEHSKVHIRQVIPISCPRRASILRSVHLDPFQHVLDALRVR